MALGDSHRGYRVVGTDENFYRHYRYRRDQGVRFADGQQPQQVRDVALGAEVAQKLGYSVGKDVVLTHGMGAAGILDHDDKPFRVVGILQRTATPIDRSLFITLEGVEAIHEGWEEGVPAAPSLDAAEKDDHDDDDHKHADHKHADHKQADHKDDDHDHAEHDHSAHAHGDGEHVQLSAFLLRTKNRVDTLRLMREINTYTGEPMTAIIPGVTLNDLWSTVSYVETALKIISIFVVGVGLCGMLVALYTTLNERRREMAILRAVGAGPGRIAGLFILESGLLALAGIGLGIAFNFLGIALLQGFVEQRFGLYLRWQGLTASDALVLCILFAAALLIGLIPAWRAYRNSLADGLSVRI
jgi:putative ABC transport system permease protein